ncbi:MAG: O-methyltransferase [Myxococcaceae bacterium]
MILAPNTVEAFIEAHSEKPSTLLLELQHETRQTMESPGMMVGPVEGAFLRMLVRLTRARRVLEIGTFTGYSALMMAEGLPGDGELITCDLDPRAVAVARRYFEQSPHGRKISVRLGPALETLRGLQGPFDLVFIDADKEHYPDYYDAVFPMVRPGGLIVGDNALWSGRVLSPRSESDRAIVAFDDQVALDERVEKVLLPVRDGMMIAYKR